jgi:hypothetical protein
MGGGKITFDTGVSGYEVYSLIARVGESSLSNSRLAATFHAVLVDSAGSSMQSRSCLATEMVLTGFRQNSYLTAPFLRDRSSIPHVTPFCGTVSGEIFPTTLPLCSISV